MLNNMQPFDNIKNTIPQNKYLQDFHTDFLTLKDLNSKLSILKMLVQDYSVETMPQWVNFATTFVCNLRCPFCQNHGTEENRKKYNDTSLNMKYEMLMRLARESLPWAREFSLALNGEPLLTAHIQDFLDEVAPFGAKLDLVTNGTLLTKKTLMKLLPLAGKIQISIDSATEYTYEKLRVGAKFKRTLNSIRLLTRAVELLEEGDKPLVTFSFTIMGSNITELPEIVRLASLMKVHEVNGCFIVLYDDNQHIRNEDVNFHKERYNAYYERAHEVAEKLNISLFIPDAFPGVQPNAHPMIRGEGMIINQLPEDYYEKLRPPEAFLDQNIIEIEATEIASMIRLTSSNRATLNKDTPAKRLNAQLQNSFRNFLEYYETKIKEMADKEDKKIKYCEFLHNRIYIYPEGYVVPCCTVGRPTLGDINNSTTKEVWNGDLYNEFRRRFYSSNPYECCKGCVHVQYLSWNDVVKSIL